MSKFLPHDPREFAKFLRERVCGHAPGYDIAVYARPHQWAAIATMLERASEIPPAKRETEA